MKKFGAIVLVGLIAFASARAAARQTDDAVRDTLTALLAAEQFDEAEWLCRFERDRSGSDSLRHARWSARLAEVFGRREANALLTAKPAELPGRITDAIERATEPIKRHLDDGQESPHAVFLQATSLAVRQHQVRAGIIVTTVAPTPPEVLDDLLTRISRLQRDLTELQKRARDLWSRRQAMPPTDRRDQNEPMPASEYERLIGELAVQRISLALLQTELFPRGGRDFSAAATDAVTIAEEVLPSLAEGTPAKRTANALLAKALLRGGEVERAGGLIRAAAATPSETPADVASWTALAVEYQLARGDTETAEAICDTYDRLAAQANSAPGDSSAMDFARLEVLLASGSEPRRLTEWLETIADRGGAFARRRAEAIVVASLGKDAARSTSDPRPGVDPALVALQGEDALRRDEPQRAAALLRQAALATGDPGSAIRYATRSAAAAVSADDTDSAATVLIETARRHSGSEAAAGLMMQAALLMSEQIRSADGDATSSQVERLQILLAELAQTWPQAASAFQANQWRCRMLTAAGRHAEAADAALEFLTLRKQPDQLPMTAHLWFDHVSRLPEADVGERLRVLAAATDEITKETPPLKPHLDRVASWLFEPQDLAGRTVEAVDVDEADQDRSLTAPLASLMRFRQGRERQVSLDGLSEEMRERVRWRLRRDAFLQPQRRPAIGAVLLRFPDATPWQQAVAEFWGSPDRGTIGRIRQLALAAEASSGRLQQAIGVLARGGNREATSVAVELSDRLANSHAIGSESWYRAKLRAIELLGAAGESAEAKKRARYVLLVRPPQDASLKRRLEAIAESP
jgi:hypothetical protein